VRQQIITVSSGCWCVSCWDQWSALGHAKIFLML